MPSFDAPELGRGCIEPVPHPGLTSRLTEYFRITKQFVEKGSDSVSNSELATCTSINPVQVRRDLRAIGFSGTRGVGYQARELIEFVRKTLNLRENYSLVVVGAGNLGTAIARSTVFPKGGFVVRDVLDNSPEKVGCRIGSFTIKHVNELEGSVLEDSLVIGVITTPSLAAQEVVHRMVNAGIKTILNYTGALLRTPEDVQILSIDPTIQLSCSLYRLAEGQA